ncbi:MAG TPA: glycoside hydrolase family 15 protein [Candidatus Acidoferrum sp.]|nr:glycoside hydrolase family 15 protein [Candidatus Acidoferrum sp.]
MLASRKVSSSATMKRILFARMRLQRELFMPSLRCLFAFVFIVVAGCVPARASNLVTGNGFGFAVVSPQTASVTKFYAHPYAFTAPDPKDSLSEGIPTTNFIQGLSWGAAPNAGASADYDNDSQVIRVHSSSGEGIVFMPFGLLQSALIVSWQPAGGASANGWTVTWTHAVKSQRLLQIGGISARLLEFDSVPDSLLLIPLDSIAPHPVSDQDPFAGSSAWALVSLDPGANPEETIRDFVHWCAGLSASALAQREIAQLERWRVQPTVHFASEAERQLWRQSEVLLRLAQCREPNRPGRHGNGLIVASLPDGLWFTPWVRDMAFATVALARMGHRAEARAAVLAYFNAQPTGKMRAQTAGADDQISVVRYFGDGSEEPFFTDEGSTNIEFDDWGLALWALGTYMQETHYTALLRATTYRGPLYASARDFVVKPLFANLENYGGGQIVAADTSIWEERQKDKKHFAFSTAAAIVGLRSFAEVAQLAGDEATRADVLRHVALLQKGFNAAFIRDGELHGTLEPGIKNNIDGALLAVIHFGVVTDPAIVRNTVRRMALLKVASGGYRRVRSTYTDPKIFEYWYERQEFLYVDVSLAEVDRSLGNFAAADAIVRRIVDKAVADHDLIPEMYVAVPCTLFPGKIGDPTGALPMVGYGAGEYILDLLNRQRYERVTTEGAHGLGA